MSHQTRRTPADAPASGAARSDASERPKRAPRRTTKYVKVYVADDLHEALTVTSADWGVTISGVVRQILRRALLAPQPTPRRGGNGPT